MSTAIVIAWFPAETRPAVPVILAAVFVVLIPWAWSHCGADTVRGIGAAAAVLSVLSISGASGLDPSRALGTVGLAAAVVGLIWMASRSPVPDWFPLLLAIGLAGLAVWGIWQASAGSDAVGPLLESLPESSRAYAAERLSSGRGYASLPLPGHLAVLLATALPLLVGRVRATLAGFVAAAAAAVVLIGIVATKSPIGAALAVVGVVAVVAGRSRRHVVAVGALAAVIVTAVVMARPDVRRLEPVSLRLDNWQVALWLTTTSPASGVGVASFAQASQAVPMPVGNRPAHAHNLVFEMLAELGPIGLLGCLVLAAWLARVVLRVWPRDRPIAVALCMVPLHNLVDFSCFVSSVIVPWAVLVGWAIAGHGAPRRAPAPIWGRTVLVTVAAAGLAVTAIGATAVVVERAAASQSEPVERFDGALRSLRLAPWRVEPQFLLAASALESAEGDLLDRAWYEMVALRWARPRSAALAERRARVALARGDATEAVAELWAAVEFGLPDVERRRAFEAVRDQVAAMADEEN